MTMLAGQPMAGFCVSLTVTVKSQVSAVPLPLVATHFTGVILRLNDDGTAPEDNPFFEHGERVGGEVGANIQKIFAYGIRNGFGMAVDPRTGNLWEQENGDDSFSELNRVSPGMNSGWAQIMGPVERIAQYKAIETDPTAPQPFASQWSYWRSANTSRNCARW